MELQAIRYAAMVSPMTFQNVVDVHTRHLAKLGLPANARKSILAVLDCEEPDEKSFAQDVRIVLASADFSKEVTTSVIWLNKQGLDIRCVRIKPYIDGGRVFIDVQQVIPLPEAAQYQIRISEKAERERQDRTSDVEALWLKFWQVLLPKAKLKTGLHSAISPGMYDCVSVGVGVRGLVLQYVIRKERALVQLYIDRGSGERDVNKRFYDSIYSHKVEIETSFGGPLLWERRDEKQSSCIAYSIPSGGLRSEQSMWPEIQDRMIDAMIRLDRAVKPFVAELMA